MLRCGHSEAAPAARHDDGRALIEVVFLAVLLLIPVVYVLASVLRLQSATLAVAQAARDVGRLIETAPDASTLGSADDVARVALRDQNVPADGLQLRTVALGADCRQAPEIAVTLRPGASYDVCVIAVITLPGVPTVLSGSDNTVTGVYSVHIGELREGR